MGFDMTVANPDPAVVAAKDQAEAEFTRRVAARNLIPEDSPHREAAQTAVAEAYDKLFAADQSYFRLNIWGMGEARQMMLEDGAVVELEHPAFTGDKDVDQRMVDGDPGADGIASYKLCSNDGWLVSPGECRAAVRKMRERVNPPDWYVEWTNYLEYAMERGGFRVW